MVDTNIYVYMYIDEQSIRNRFNVSGMKIKKEINLSLFPPFEVVKSLFVCFCCCFLNKSMRK